MKDLEEGSIITLNDDKEYIIVHIINMEGNTYLNLLSNGGDAGALFVKVVSDYGVTILTESLSDEEINKLIDIIASR